MIFNEFLRDKESLKWLLQNKIYTWEIRKSYPVMKDGETFNEVCDGLMKKTVVDNKTGQKYIYELIIPSFNCNTMFYGAAASKSDKTSIIPIYYNIFNDILEIYSKEKLPKGGREEKVREIIGKIKIEFESCNGVWKNSYLSSSLVKTYS